MKTRMSWVEIYKKWGIYILLAVVFAVFSIAAPNFLATKNVINILRQSTAKERIFSIIFLDDGLH